MAKLFFYYGAMGAAKTAQAIITAYNYAERGQNALCMKPSIDTRTTSKISSRLGIERNAAIIRPTTDIQEYIRNYNEHHPKKLDAVIVDEAQFLTKAQVWNLAKIVDEDDIPVMCFGLRSDFKGDLFPGSGALLAIADEIHEIKTMCWCGSKATMNARFLDGAIVKEGEQIKIGSNESYIALCRKHYQQEMLEAPKPEYERYLDLAREYSADAKYNYKLTDEGDNVVSYHFLGELSFNGYTGNHEIAIDLDGNGEPTSIWARPFTGDFDSSASWWILEDLSFREGVKYA